MRAHHVTGDPAIVMLPGVKPFLSHQEQSLGVLDGFGRAAYHDDVALLENRVRAGLPADDSVAPHGAYGRLRSSFRELRDALSHSPSMRRQHHAVKLFTKCVIVIQKFGTGRPKVLPKHSVAVAADIVHGAD